MYGVKQPCMPENCFLISIKALEKNLSQDRVKAVNLET